MGLLQGQREASEGKCLWSLAGPDARVPPSRVVGIPQERPLGRFSFHLPSHNNNNNQARFSALFMYTLTQILFEPI